jgi:hypothetical protein
MARRFAIVATLAAAAPATAEPAPTLRRQVQADFGLAVIGLGYEHPLAARLALQLEGQIFGTYFLPWFDAGDDATGVGAELRATWFARPSGYGLYLLAYGRMDAVRIERGDLRGNGFAVSGGGAVGWSFRLTHAARRVHAVPDARRHPRLPPVIGGRSEPRIDLARRRPRDHDERDVGRMGDRARRRRIAKQLKIDCRTVEIHRRNIMAKLGEEHGGPDRDRRRYRSPRGPQLRRVM